MSNLDFILSTTVSDLLCFFPSLSFTFCLFPLFLVSHQGPISGLVFHPTRSLLASCGWDRSVRLWDVFEGHRNTSETWTTQSEALAMAFRPDGKEACVAALDGQLYFFDVENG
jgi:periodic tryptophan protein 2